MTPYTVTSQSQFIQLNPGLSDLITGGTTPYCKWLKRLPSSVCEINRRTRCNPASVMMLHDPSDMAHTEYRLLVAHREVHDVAQQGAVSAFACH